MHPTCNPNDQGFPHVGEPWIELTGKEAKAMMNELDVLFLMLVASFGWKNGPDYWAVYLPRAEWEWGYNC